MAIRYLMQARDSVTGALHTWVTAAPDWTGALYDGAGTPSEIALQAVNGLDPSVQGLADVLLEANTTGANATTPSGVGGIVISSGDTLDLHQSASDPVAIADRGRVYTRDVGGVTELFYLDSAGTPVQVTAAGGLAAPTLNSVLQAGNSTIDRDLIVSAGTRLALLGDGTTRLSGGAGLFTGLVQVNRVGGGITGFALNDGGTPVATIVAQIGNGLLLSVNDAGGLRLLAQQGDVLVEAQSGKVTLKVATEQAFEFSDGDGAYMGVRRTDFGGGAYLGFLAFEGDRFHGFGVRLTVTPPTSADPGREFGVVGGSGGTGNQDGGAAYLQGGEATGAGTHGEAQLRDAAGVTIAAAKVGVLEIKSAKTVDFAGDVAIARQGAPKFLAGAVDTTIRGGSTGHQWQGSGGATWASMTASVFELAFPATMRFAATVVSPVITQAADVSAGAVCDTMQLKAQSSTATSGTNTGGHAHLAGGDATGVGTGIRNGGHVYITPGAGSGGGSNTTGNTALGAIPAGWGGMQRGLHIPRAVAAPTAAPAAGCFLWCDPTADVPMIWIAGEGSAQQLSTGV